MIFRMIFGTPCTHRAAMESEYAGRSLDEFLDRVWAAREPISPVSRGPWPLVRIEHQQPVTNVKQIRPVSKGR